MIGLPLFLLLERFISQKIVVRVMPLLDQLCFKTTHHWFVAYYLICRQVIILIVFVGNTNYYNIWFYLQTACVIFAIIHILVLPYHTYNDDTVCYITDHGSGCEHKHLSIFTENCYGGIYTTG